MKNVLEDRSTWRWLLTHSRKQMIPIVLLILGNGIFAATSAGFALICRGIIDSAVGGNPDGIWQYGLGLAGIITLQFALRLTLCSMEEWIQAKLEMNLRQHCFRAILSKQYADIRNYHSGEILNRMFSDISIICDGLTNILPTYINLVTRILCAVVVLIALEPRLTVFFLCAGLCMFLATQFFRKRIKHLHKEVQQKEGRVRSFLQEAVENILIIKVFGLEEKMTAKNHTHQSEHFSSRMKRRRISILANAGFSLSFQMGYLIAMLWGAFRIYTKSMSYGTLTAILQLVNQIQTPFANLSALLPKYYGMIASAERILELEKLTDEKACTDRLAYEDLQKITLRQMNFSYQNEKEHPVSVLKEVNLTIQKGDLISLTGISGGGKTTLFLLLMGAYQPTTGAIHFLSKQDKNYLPGKETRQLFAYVPQGNILFSGTVAENISFLRDHATAEEIENAASIACAAEFIHSLPEGYDTKIGEKGYGISEGQAQRIAIARAILSGAPFLLLDEATSALDEQTEATVLQHISELSDKTLLVVTHRPAALAICNRHLILKDGCITEKY